MRARRRVRVGKPACRGVRCAIFSFEGGSRSRWEEHDTATCPQGRQTVETRRPPREDRDWSLLVALVGLVAFVVLWLIFVAPQLP